MDIEKFWRLIEESRVDGDDDCESQVEHLKQSLAKLPAEEIIAFDKILLDLRFAAYRWDLWGAAYIINGGCSDDCFEYFRGWLIAQGETVYQEALRNPDSLAAVIDSDIEYAECESLNYVALDAYESKTGQEMPQVDVTYPEITGERWQEDKLEEIYPNLYAKTDWPDE